MKANTYLFLGIMMNLYIYLFIFLFCGQLMSMDRPYDIAQIALNNYNSTMGIYVQPSQANGMVSLLARQPTLNNLSITDKKTLEDAAVKFNKPFLRDLAQTVTIRSEDGQNFAIPLKIARETQKLSMQFSDQNSPPIQLNLNAQLLELYCKASWYFCFTDTLFWMKSYRMLDSENVGDLLRAADMLGADFIRRTINDANQRTGKF